jgi:type I restriction enzyme S subunit
MAVGQTLVFRDFITLQRGFDLPRSHRTEGSYPVVGAAEYQGTHAEAKIPGPMVTTGRSGTVGSVLYTKSAGWPLNTCLWVRDFKGNNPYYVYCVLKMLDLAQFNSGAGVPTLNRNHLDGIVLQIHERSDQDRIATILSAYDDLIENNTRRIAILEEMARRIFEEWFVHFRAPCCEGLPMVESAIGLIPKGWEVATIRDVCERIDYGYTAKASNDAVGPKLLRITDIVPSTIDWAHVPCCEIPDHKQEQYVLRSGDIVVARTGATTGYAKRLNKHHPRSVFASYLVRMRANKRCSDLYLGQIIESAQYKAFVARNFGGAAQPNVNAQVLASMQIVVPPKAALNEFDGIIETFIDLKEVLERGSANLRTQRDLLLPKLVSGEIDVSRSAAALPEAAE